MEEYLTINELSEKLKVSKRTVLREISRGKISVRKAGRKYLIPENSLNLYLRRNSPIQGQIREFCQSAKHEMVALLQKLVAVSSVAESNGEETLARLLKSELEKFGIRSIMHGEGQYITVQASFGYAGKGIMIDCPLDTTPAGDLSHWTYPPYDGVIKKGRMYGRGTADCKAGIVSAIYTILALRGLIDEKKIRVELVFDGGEQNGAYFGMKSTLKKGLDIQAGIIGYGGTSRELSIGCRGYHRFTFTTHGRAQHTGHRFERGINAIDMMAKFMVEIEKIKFPKPKNKYFFFGSHLTFSMIQGGRAINIVPDECISKLDIRTVPEFKKEDAINMVKKVVNKLKKEDLHFSISSKYDLGEEGYVLNENEKITKVMLESIKQVAGKTPKIVVNGPSHIGTILHKHNVPIIIWGPEGGNVHAYNEYIEIDSLPETTEVYANSILKFFEQQ